jgi:hypothetical protein
MFKIFKDLFKTTPKVEIENQNTSITFHGPINAKGGQIGNITDVNFEGGVTVNGTKYEGKHFLNKDGKVFIDGKQIEL